MINKKLFLVLAIVGVFIILFFALIGLLRRGGLGPDEDILGVAESEVSIADHFRGNQDAEVVLVEYSDFQCPACVSSYPLVKQLADDFSDKIKIIYKHFPLSQHKNAKPAAFAAEAAGLQGKFWEMHDMLLEKHGVWANAQNVKEIFVEFARNLNLDEGKFLQDFDSQPVKSKVNSDYQRGASLGVPGTPSFFLNGAKLETPRSYEEFKNVIEEAVSKVS